MDFHFLTHSNRKLTIVTILVITIFLSLFCWKEKTILFYQTPQNLSVTTCLPPASLDGKKFSWISFFKVATPCGTLSKEELQEFPGVRVVEATEIEGPEIGQKTRLRILETHCKYPYIRTEETIDKASGNILHRSEMAATHFLVRLPAEEDAENFLNQLGPDAIALERVTTKERLYRLQLNSHSLAVLTRVFNEITNKQLPVIAKEPDFIVHAAMKPNNPLYSTIQWYLWKSCSNIEGSFDKRIFFSGIDAYDAWDLQTSAESVVVAVIDTGIRYTHEDLAANMWHENNPIYGTIYGWNFSVKDDDIKKSDPMDGFGHGTACAGIIGAVGNSGLGVTGVAWKVKLMALKFLDDQGVGYTSDTVSSIDFAVDHGARILNCSWGYVSSTANSNAGNLISAEKSTALQASIKRAQDLGVIVVAAAGNEGKDNDQNPEYPANYPLDNIVSVAATTEENQLASFSNYGATTVDLAAPGEEIFSTWARSDHDYITDQTRKEIFNPNDDSTIDISKYPCGTSCSVPQVVGALALMKEHFPTWTYQQLIKRVIDTSDQLPSLVGKMVGGKLNVARALSDPISSSSSD